MLRLQATIPNGLKFEDLALTRDPVTGTVRFDPAPLQAICDASGLDLVALVSSHDGVVCALIAAWYEDHLREAAHPIRYWRRWMRRRGTRWNAAGVFPTRLAMPELGRRSA